MRRQGGRDLRRLACLLIYGHCKPIAHIDIPAARQGIRDRVLEEADVFSIYFSMEYPSIDSLCRFPLRWLFPFRLFA